MCCDAEGDDLPRTARGLSPLATARGSGANLQLDTKRADGVPALCMIEPNPFAGHHVRRFAYAWEQLSGRSGKHLDVGCNRCEFLSVLAAKSGLKCRGIDAHSGYLAEARETNPVLDLQLMPPGRFALPYPDDAFQSVTLLDTLEHVRDERECLSEIARILVRGGRLIVTVPRLHVFSFMDPDNAKLKFPGLHRAIYTARFGRELYRKRFEDLSDGLRGDMHAAKLEHTNYSDVALEALMTEAGFRIVDRGGANLFWRFFDIPALFLRGRQVHRFLHWLIFIDGRLFARANLFMTAERV